MTDKNHEQYLEEIETAVAETTMDILEKHNSDLRKLAKVCAEKQLQVKRLKEFQENDRSTIRTLRAKLERATEEIECRNSTWETKEGEYEGEIVELKEEIVAYKEELDIAHFEYDKLKDENRRADHDACSHLRQILELKEEIEFLKNQLDVGGMMNFSKYND